jgi:hypothetical protein
MSLLLRWCLVWSLYGRFWCRSSLEVPLRRFPGARVHVVNRHVARDAGSEQAMIVSRRDEPMPACNGAENRRKPAGLPRPARSEAAAT